MTLSTLFYFLMLKPERPDNYWRMSEEYNRWLPVIFCFFLLFFKAVFNIDKSALFCPSKQEEARESAGGTALLALCCALLLALRYRKFFPYGVSPDVKNQLAQITGQLSYNKIHTIGHTMILELSHSLFGSVTPVVLLQMAGIVFLYCLFARFFMKKGASYPLVLLLFGMAALYAPVFTDRAYFFPWKDTPAALCLAAVTLILMKWEDTDWKQISDGTAALLGAALAGCAIFRLNGIIAAAVVGAVSVGTLIKRRYFKKLVILISTAAISIGIVEAYSAWIARPIEMDNGFSIQVFGEGIAAMVNSGELTEEELEEIDEILSVKWMQENYNIYNKGQMILARDGSPEVTSDPDYDIFNNAFVMQMGANRGEVIRLYFRLMPKHLSVCLKDVITNLKMFLQSGRTLIASYPFLFSVLAILCIIGKLRPSELIVFLPSLCNSVSIMISTISSEGRYILPAFMLAPALILYCIWKGEQHRREDAALAGLKG